MLASSIAPEYEWRISIRCFETRPYNRKSTGKNIADSLPFLRASSEKRQALAMGCAE